jgi:trans-aconitate methyltransferase
VPSASIRAHAGLTFANPFSASAVDEAVARLDPAPGGHVVETGCGSAEVLLRVLERHPGTRGVGVDLDPDRVARARRAAEDRLRAGTCGSSRHRRRRPGSGPARSTWC